MISFALGLLLVCSACVSAPPPPAADPLDSAWAEFGRFDLLDVQIERRHYERTGHPHFFIRVRLLNPTETTVGVDLRDEWRVLYPNQWGGLEQPERMIIDERIAVPKALTPELAAHLRAAFRSGRLATIPAGASIEYFREFNASGRAAVDATNTPYLFVSIKGQLFATGGARVENVVPDADSLYLRVPVAWGAVPDGARVVADD